MSGMHSRHTPSPTTSPSPSSPPTQAPSKLPKFLQNKANRDRSKSVSANGVDPAMSTSSLASGSSGGGSISPEISQGGSGKRRGSKFLGVKSKAEREEREARRSSDSRQSHNAEIGNANGQGQGQENADSSPPVDISEPPVIIEPQSVPRARTRSERPATPSMPSSHMLNSNTTSHPAISLHPSSSTSTSASRISDLPTRLSGWFSHTFSTSTTDLSLPSLLAHSASPHNTHPSRESYNSNSSSSQSVSSPMKGKASALLTAAKHGKGHLDKAMRYLLDSDSTPDKCTDPIWILGVVHPGWEPPPPSPPVANTQLAISTPGRKSSGSPPAFRSSTSSLASTASLSRSLSQSQQHSGKHGKDKDPSAYWPPVFYADFTSRVWLTYRSQFPTPIRDQRLGDLCGDPSSGSVHSGSSSGGKSAEGGGIVGSPTTVRRPWNWGGEKSWTSDSGWGCMLRTGQSLLANALMHLHLGRDWRRPPYPIHTADYATYVQILTWFLDTPAPDAPFSVHRMALAGKELGTDVGQWFGPSTAAGAIRTLVQAFPEAGLGVSVASDGMLFQSDIFAASHTDLGSRSPKRHGKGGSTTWGDRPVLLLLGIRLGIDGVNPIYYETIKQLYTFPQSVGIAGGRPSSSYYFVGSQADNLFYLDPHHARPAIPLRPPPHVPAVINISANKDSTPENDKESARQRQRSPTSSPYNNRVPTSPSSIRTGSSTFSYHAPVSPSPLQHQFSTSSADSSEYPHTRSPPSSQHHGRWRSASASQASSPGISSPEMDFRELGVVGEGGSSFAEREEGLDPIQEHYCTAYSAAELNTFHCERVRKMPLSGLDPSMLIGFLCRDEADWWDFRRRVAELPRTIFSIQDEPPSWSSDMDDNVGMESMSEQDDLDMDMDEEDDASGEQFFDTRSGSPSIDSRRGQSDRSKSEEVDTEEDPVDPVTPGPNSKFEIIQPVNSKGIGKGREVDFDPEADEEPFDDDIEDDWVDPSIPSPSLPTPTSGAPYPTSSSPSSKGDPSPAPRLAKSKSQGSAGKKKKTKKQVPVPVPMVRIPSSGGEHYPFPVTPADDAPVTPHERTRNISNGKTGGKRMHTARARDGGRTQSGGVKGILPEDS
ncbi:peptidase family C54-domain-containing protein [Crucibulum laeve]|uniref:Autophagy-related protein 4 n=1 Tax=Crucibulum laeve TaxID=68775 RepID=A0A5C3LK37_9AGAR|nr:peptidase family C54-domain-containing protein [Crucibulum laeve]